MNRAENERLIDLAINASHASVAIQMGLQAKAEQILDRQPLPPAYGFALGLQAAFQGMPALAGRLLSKEALSGMTPKAMGEPLRGGERKTPMEHALDCPDPQSSLAAQGALQSLPFNTPRSAVAEAIRRAESPEQAGARFEAARALGLLDSRLVSLLADHSQWCENGTAELARSERERRALDRSAPQAAAAPKPRL